MSRKSRLALVGVFAVLIATGLLLGGIQAWRLRAKRRAARATLEAAAAQHVHRWLLQVQVDELTAPGSLARLRDGVTRLLDDRGGFYGLNSLDTVRAKLLFAGDESDPILDPWGRPIRYRMPGYVHRQGWDLWSCGPDGVDDHGDGDDVVIGEDLAPVSSTR